MMVESQEDFCQRILREALQQKQKREEEAKKREIESSQLQEKLNELKQSAAQTNDRLVKLKDSVSKNVDCATMQLGRHLGADQYKKMSREQMM